MKRLTALLVSLVLLAAVPFIADARITKLVVAPSPYETTSFGDVGPYEKLVGQAFGELDPRHPLNAIIQDIELAPTNARGMVEYVTDVIIVKPVDLKKGNGTLTYNIVNRGGVGQMNIGVSGGNNPTTAGDGFLHKRGFTMLWSGWQGDILRTGGRLSMDLPIARNADGSSITGRVRTEYVFAVTSGPVPSSVPLSQAIYTSGTRVYETVSLDNTTATLTKRVREKDPRVLVPHAEWAFADCSSVPWPGTPSTSHICVKDGFDNNHIYELLYTAKDPIVLGIGYAGIRDLIAFLKHAVTDDVGTPNPLAGGIHTALIEGSSQSGNALRGFLHLGFNEDEEGRIVADGAHPSVAAGMQPLNVRFGQPGRAPFEHVDHLFPRYEGPISWMPVRDPLRARTGWVLERCTTSHTCPKIVSSFTSSDYWNHRMAASTTDAFGRHDLAVPGHVRMYQAASAPHAASNNPDPKCMYPTVNPNNRIYLLRAMHIALYEWVTKGIQPPKSQYPTLRTGTLVPPAELHWPAVPGIVYTGLVNSYPMLDFGPGFQHDDVSGVMTNQPPVLTGEEYTILVPQVDADGNDIAGVHTNLLLAPIGTYTGWNYRAAGFSEGAQCDNRGIFVPFAQTPAERLTSGDSRLSLEERYGTHEGYVAAVRAAAQKLVAERYLLQEDADTLIANAEASDILK